jgi:hypothetical protein
MQQEYIIISQYSIVNNHLAFAPLHLSRNLYKSALFMQNKPNFRKSQMNVNLLITTDYENISDWTLGQNKPNSNPIKPCPERSRMGQLPKSQNECKLTYNKGLQKKRCFRSPNKQTQFKPNSNPIKANFKSPQTHQRSGKKKGPQELFLGLSCRK